MDDCLGRGRSRPGLGGRPDWFRQFRPHHRGRATAVKSDHHRAGGPLLQLRDHFDAISAGVVSVLAAVAYQNDVNSGLLDRERGVKK